MSRLAARRNAPTRRAGAGLRSAKAMLRPTWGSRDHPSALVRARAGDIETGLRARRRIASRARFARANDLLGLGIVVRHERRSTRIAQIAPTRTPPGAGSGPTIIARTWESCFYRADAALARKSEAPTAEPVRCSRWPAKGPRRGHRDVLPGPPAVPEAQRRRRRSGGEACARSAERSSRAPTCSTSRVYVACTRPPRVQWKRLATPSTGYPRCCAGPRSLVCTPYSRPVLTSYRTRRLLAAAEATRRPRRLHRFLDNVQWTPVPGD